MTAGGLDIKELWQVVRKHAKVIATLALLGLALAVYVAVRATPVYKASSRLIIERPNQGTGIDSLYGVMGVGWEFYPNQVAIMRSKPVAERVVQKLGLDKTAAAANRPSRWYQKWLPEAWKNPQNKADPDKAHKAAVNAVRSSVMIAQEPGTSVFTIGFDDTDPKMAAAKANALAESYLEEVLESRLKTKQRDMKLLAGQLPELEAKVKRAEQALRDFQKRQKLLVVEGADSLYSDSLATATARLAELRRKEAALAPLYQRVQASLQTPDQLARVPALLEKPAVAQAQGQWQQARDKVNELKRRYGPKHPKMIQALAAESAARKEFDDQLRTAANAVGDEYRMLTDEISHMQAEVERSQNQLKQKNEQDFELAALKRDYEFSQQVYSDFLKKFKQTDAVSDKGMQALNARVMDYADVPERAYKPNRKGIVAGGLAIGALLGLALAFLLEYLDNTFRTTEEVERKLQLPVIGTLPELSDKELAEAPAALYFSRKGRSSFAEAVRTLRTGVLLSRPDADKLSLLVTSSVPGEGKTTTAVNLATALSHLGPTVLVEADLRRPAVANSLQSDEGVERNNKAEGLTACILGQKKLAECLQKLPGENLYLLPSGAVPANPLEILSSRKFNALLEKLKEKFQYVVLDCSPVLAVSDALVLGRLVDGALFVLRADNVPRQMAVNAVTKLRRVGVPVLGVGINRLAARMGKYGKYSNYEGAYYTDYGYHAAGTSSQGSQ